MSLGVVERAREAAAVSGNGDGSIGQAFSVEETDKVGLSSDLSFLTK